MKTLIARISTLLTAIRTFLEKDGWVRLESNLN